MKVLRSYFGLCVLIGSLLLNSIPVHGMYAYKVEIGYSTTLNSKKDIRNLLLLLGGLTAIGLLSYWIFNKIEQSNNPPPAPRPANPSAPAPAVQTPDQELKKIKNHRASCTSTYIVESDQNRRQAMYHDLADIAGAALYQFASEEQRKTIDIMPEQQFNVLAERYFNAQKSSVADYQKRLADNIEQLERNIKHINDPGFQEALKKAHSAEDPFYDIASEQHRLEDLKSKLEFLRLYINHRRSHLELYQQVNRIEKHSGTRLELLADQADISDVLPRQFPIGFTRESYKQAVVEDARTLPHALNKVLEADRTVTPVLYQKAYDMNPNLQTLARMVVSQPSAR